MHCCCPIFPCQIWCRTHGLRRGYEISTAAHTKLLKTRDIYHLTVSTGQEPGQKSFAQGRTELQSMLARLGFHLGLWVLPQAHVVVGGNQLVEIKEDEVSSILPAVSQGLLSAARYHPLMLPHSPLPGARPTKQFTSSGPAEISLPLGRTQSLF